MAFGIGAAILGGSVASGLFARSQAAKSMGFQQKMAENAHQMEVRDLRAAGLNPILSGTGGPGAKPGGGAMPTTPDFASSAQAALRIDAEIKLIEEQARGAGNKADISGVQAAIARALLAAGKGAIVGESTAKGFLGNMRDLNKGIGATTPKMQSIIDKARAKSKTKVRFPNVKGDKFQ